MQNGIHPDVNKVKFICACGNEFFNESTAKGKEKKDVVSVEICNKCHPFFTGKSKLVDTSGRVEKFNKKIGKK